MRNLKCMNTLCNSGTSALIDLFLFNARPAKKREKKKKRMGWSENATTGDGWVGERACGCVSIRFMMSTAQAHCKLHLPKWEWNLHFAISRTGFLSHWSGVNWHAINQKICHWCSQLDTCAKGLIKSEPLELEWFVSRLWLIRERNSFEEYRSECSVKPHNYSRFSSG